MPTPSLKLSRQELRLLVRYIDIYTKLHGSLKDIIHTPSFAAYLTDWRQASLLMPKTGSRVVQFGEHGPRLILMLNAAIEGEIVVTRRKRKLFHHLYRLMQTTFEPRPLRVRMSYTTLQRAEDALRERAATDVRYREALHELERVHPTFVDAKRKTVTPPQARQGDTLCE